MRKVSLAETFGRFDDRWSPKIVAEVNDVHVKIAKVDGEFVWHRHEFEDELFLVVDGNLSMYYRDGDGRERCEQLRGGEFVVVPRNVEHKPVAAPGTKLLLVEPKATVNTGLTGGDRTVAAEWI